MLDTSSYSVCVGEVPIVLAGGLPMPPFLPYMDMGELPDAGGRVPGANPCAIVIIIIIGISDIMMVLLSINEAACLFILHSSSLMFAVKV